MFNFNESELIDNDFVFTEISNDVSLGSFNVNHGENSIWIGESLDFLGEGVYFLYFESEDTQITRYSTNGPDVFMTDLILATNNETLTCLKRINNTQGYKFNIEMILDYPVYTDSFVNEFVFDKPGVNPISLSIHFKNIGLKTFLFSSPSIQSSKF